MIIFPQHGSMVLEARGCRAKKTSNQLDQASQEVRKSTLENRNYFRLGFAAIPLEAIEPGVRELADVIHREIQ